MSRRDLVGYRNDFYTPGRTVFAFAGRVSHAACVALVEEAVGALPKQRARSCRRVKDNTALRPSWVESKPIEQSHLAMGIRLFGIHDERRYALKLLNVVLGENMSSRLFQVVREKRGLAYSVHSSTHLMSDSGALVIGAGLDRRRTVPAVKLIVRELRRLKEKPVGRREFARARDYVLGQMRISMESTSHQMMWLGNNLLAHNRFVPPEEVIAAIRAVTPADIQALAAKCLTTDVCSVCLVSPDMTSGDDAVLSEVADAL
jgi:predicted Zn-dependent peptidase